MGVPLLHTIRMSVLVLFIDIGPTVWLCLNVAFVANKDQFADDIIPETLANHLRRYL